MGKKVIFFKLTNRHRVSEVCTLINNDIRHQSCQNVVGLTRRKNACGQVAIGISLDSDWLR